MWHAFKKHDGKVVVVSSVELKAKDISWLEQGTTTVFGRIHQRAAPGAKSAI